MQWQSYEPRRVMILQQKRVVTGCGGGAGLPVSACRLGACKRVGGEEGEDVGEEVAWEVVPHSEK